MGVENLTEQLEKLASLRKEGEITEEEFEASKRQILMHQPSLNEKPVTSNRNNRPKSCIGCFVGAIFFALVGVVLLAIIGRIVSPIATSQSSVGPKKLGDGVEKSETELPPNIRTMNFKGVGEREVGIVDGVGYCVATTNRINSIGNALTQTKADGQFLIVRLGVLNTSNETHTITCSLITLIDGKGRRFSPSSTGDVALEMAGDNSAQPLLAEVQPGVQKLISIVYDVPKGDKNFRLNIPHGTFSLSPDATIKVY